MSQNRTVSFFGLLVIAAFLAAIFVMIFTEPASTARPAGKPRKLAPAEQREAGGWKRRGE